MKKTPIIHWFRQDLRISDNPSLFKASLKGSVLPVFILDDDNPGKWSMGAASRWWLHHSLESLNRSLQGRLTFLRGDPLEILPALAASTGAKEVCWNRCYEPWRITRDTRLKHKLREQGITAESFNGSMLWEPWEVHKSDGTPYKVFTPFYRKGCLGAVPPRMPLPLPVKMDCPGPPEESLPLEALELLPRIRWDRQLEPHWTIGENGALERLAIFLKDGLPGYSEGRDFPARPNVSRLSPSLHFGEISPNQAWYGAIAAGTGIDLDHFQRELAWREFSYGLLYYNPGLPEINLQKSFDRFPWRSNPELLDRWQRGMTGYPIVDAGMRELRETGYMHNRIRMVAGSFLVKNMLLHWHEGESWFRDCLADADLAINSASWQWIAGCGADAAPYFRIFNPVAQGEKFDSSGSYTRRYVPELARLPDRYLFSPWEAPRSVLDAAGVSTERTYPEPVVDLRVSRQQALDAYSATKNQPGQ
ncbi:deoxyribodipyrimidine photolyase [Chlorobium limicola]|uniref:Deoxyribodipyrimidine photo-lyase n=2 Tax=Chlorobium limicola TaxID=1092 RepID=A0A117MQF8_CHLLI|nr:deoxyribodipyrimidine photolyase [Chlorobium limicola]